MPPAWVSVRHCGIQKLLGEGGSGEEAPSVPSTGNFYKYSKTLTTKLSLQIIFHYITALLRKHLHTMQKTIIVCLKGDPFVAAKAAQAFLVRRERSRKVLVFSLEICCLWNFLRIFFS